MPTAPSWVLGTGERLKEQLMAEEGVRFLRAQESSQDTVLAVARHPRLRAMAWGGPGKEGAQERAGSPGAFSISGAFLTNLRYRVVMTPCWDCDRSSSMNILVWPLRCVNFLPTIPPEHSQHSAGV